jgi:predicted GNAT family acetyltransferase
MKIIIATKEYSKDLENLSRLASKERKGWTFQNKKQFERIINSKNEGCCITILDSSVVGYLVYKYDKKEKRFWIEQVFVKKGFRNNGVAESLIDHVVKTWKKVKHVQIVLLSGDRNLKIFNKIGFEKTMNYMEFVGKKKR